MHSQNLKILCNLAVLGKVSDRYSVLTVSDRYSVSADTENGVSESVSEMKFGIGASLRFCVAPINFAVMTKWRLIAQSTIEFGAQIL